MSLPSDRSSTAYQKRVDAAELARDRPYNRHQNNGEESDPTYPDHIANYSKGLPHDPVTGEVIPGAYTQLRAAVSSGNPQDFEDIPLGIPAPTRPRDPKRIRLTNPQSGLAFDLEGPDSHHVTQPPAPRIDSYEGAAEMAEVYWMSLLRDVDFIDFNDNQRIEQAADSLMEEFHDYPYWPKDTRRNRITPSTIFRGNFEGDLVGPYISQFLLIGNEDKSLGRDEKARYVKYGTASIDQRHGVAVKGLDFMTDYQTWLQVQNSLDTRVNPLNDGNNRHFDRRPRFIRNMRDLATYVHFDALYQAYLTACIYMLRAVDDSFDPNDRFPFDPNNPYMINRSMNQEGFGTFGGPHILSLVTEAATRALKGVWLQKWFVHRRPRPEAFGGLIHRHLTDPSGPYSVIHQKILNSSVLEKVFRRNRDLNRKYNRGDRDGTYLLSQAFTEGSLLHPSYGAGHGTVAGACVTILKAFFDEDAPIRNPVVPNETGTILEDYRGPGRNNMTVLGELNKLAANISIGRNMAGVHYRSDYMKSLKLGEEIAVGILEEQHVTMYNEPYHFTFTKFGETEKTSIPPA
jgi:hypothetical protein